MATIAQSKKQKNLKLVFTPAVLGLSAAIQLLSKQLKICIILA